ncbi:MAG: hypothetical protein ABFS34_09050 [Gemmatimonadota bacterium]
MIGAVSRLAASEARARLVLVGVVGVLFLAGAWATSATAGGAADPSLDDVFRLGGYPLVSAVLLLGWTVGRFPLFAAIALCAGLAWGGRVPSRARLVHARAVPRWFVYGTRAGMFGALAFLASAAVLPLFDLLVLGTWAGAATFTLAGAYVLAYGSLTALLSVWTRADAAGAAVLAALAHLWHGALRSGAADAVPRGVGRFFSLVLPPQGALHALEGAFAGVEPIPWDAFGYVAGYAGLLAALTAVSLMLRDV